MDSGVGGLPYLERARELLPDERFVYLADRAGFPYGAKSRGEIEAIVLDRVARLRGSCSPKALVIACNTASQTALEAVRAANPGFPVIGTVPAVKPAAQLSRSGTIGVLATIVAVADPYLDSLVQRFAPGTRVVREEAQELVEFVEHRFLGAGADERRLAVIDHVRRLVEAGADEIVLACTHFLHVADDIAAAAEEVAAGMRTRAGHPLRQRRIGVIDSREGVARRLREVLRSLSLLASPPASAGTAPRGLFLLTGPPPFEGRFAGFAARYGLGMPSPLDGPSGDAAPAVAGGTTGAAGIAGAAEAGP